MPLTRAERKDRMRHGVQTEVAEKERVSNAYVTAVMNGAVRAKSHDAKRKLRRVQVALARKLGLRVDEVFPQEQEARPTVARAS